MYIKTVQVVGLTLSVAVLSLFACSRTVPPAGEVEATEYLGIKLTPIAQQGNNAIKGTQYIDRAAYRLVVDGLVEQPLSLTYDDLLALPAESRLTDLNCVEGWYFTAKWSGPALVSIFEKVRPKPGVTTVIFHTVDADRYSSLEYSYIIDRRTIIALRLNDVTIPADRGFPFQVVAEGKFGYKWAKWVVRIELTDDTTFRGYWEQRGFSNRADVGGPAFEPRS